MTQRHKIIWLQPWCDSCAAQHTNSYGRQWCQDDVWGKCEECGQKSEKYVLATASFVASPDGPHKPRFTRVVRDKQLWLRDREQCELVGPFDSWAAQEAHIKSAVGEEPSR